MFIRGAGRQFQRPWGTYIACFAESNSVLRYSFRCPKARRPTCVRCGSATGPRCGAPLSIQKRLLYASYMSGANVVRHESHADLEGGSIYVANYDFREIERTDFLVRQLRDMPYCISPLGAVWKELYDGILTKHDRGISYAPVALLFDQHHGFTGTYNRDYYMGIIPYDDAGYMMRATIHTLFPWETRDRDVGYSGAGSTTNGPFGNIFDTVTTLASLECLQTYKVVFGVGALKEIDARLAKDLMTYVRRGGTLVINSRQLVKPLRDAAFLGVRMRDSVAKAKGYVSYLNGLNGKHVEETTEFPFDEVDITDAKPLVVTSPNAQKSSALVTINRYGKGHVVLCTPHYLYLPRSKNRMLKIFSQLMHQINQESLPLRVEGDIEYQINRNANGWVVTLINNNGLFKPLWEEPVADPEKTAHVEVTLLARAKRARVWLDEKSLDVERQAGRSRVRIAVPPGEIRIIEFLLP